MGSNVTSNKSLVLIRSSSPPTPPKLLFDKEDDLSSKELKKSEESEKELEISKSKLGISKDIMSTIRGGISKLIFPVIPAISKPLKLGKKSVMIESVGLLLLVGV